MLDIIKNAYPQFNRSEWSFWPKQNQIPCSTSSTITLNNYSSILFQDFRHNLWWQAIAMMPNLISQVVRTKSEEAWKLDANLQLYTVYKNMVISVVTSHIKVSTERVSVSKTRILKLGIRLSWVEFWQNLMLLSYKFSIIWETTSTWF